MEPTFPEALVPDFGFGFLGVAAPVVVIAIILLVWRRWNRKPEAARLGAIRLAAFCQANDALTACAPVNARDAAVQASLILRRYLAVVARDPALYETHEEFVLRHDSLLEFSVEARSAVSVGFGRLAALKYTLETPTVTAADVIAEGRALLKILHHGFAS